MATKEEIEALDPGSWVRVEGRYVWFWVEITDPTVQKIVGRGDGFEKRNVSVVEIAIPAPPLCYYQYSVEDISSGELGHSGRVIAPGSRALVGDYTSYPWPTVLVETRNLDVSVACMSRPQEGSGSRPPSYIAAKPCPGDRK